jgi:hypothetical protein
LHCQRDSALGGLGFDLRSEVRPGAWGKVSSGSSAPGNTRCQNPGRVFIRPFRRGCKRGFISVTTSNIIFNKLVRSGMSRPDHSRYIYIYASSPEEKLRFEGLAKEAGVPLSRYLLSMIEAGISSLERRPKKREDLKGKVAQLEEEIRQKDLIITNYRAALARREMQVWAQDEPGRRGYNEDLIAFLKDGKTRQAEEIFSELEIDLQDLDACQAVAMQLEGLEGLGLIRRGPRGWKWR